LIGEEPRGVAGVEFDVNSLLFAGRRPPALVGPPASETEVIDSQVSG